MATVLPLVLLLLFGALLRSPSRVRVRLPRRMRRFDATARWARTRFDTAAHGLAPREQLSARRAGPPLPPYRIKAMQAIADAAWGGDWRPAAAYVEAAATDWDERWSRLQLLQEIAHRDAAWLDAWHQAQPDNGDAATLRALLLVDQAWAIRGTEYAHKVPADRMARFTELLPAAIEAARAATLLAPKDPGPWVVMVTAARGARYSHDRFRPMWEGLVARAPHHYEGHGQALQFWCAKWAGSDRLMLQFAEQAVRSAPVGSPLAGMYLHALRELEQRHGVSALPAARDARPLLEEVVRSLDHVPADDERLPPLRHLLAHYLSDAGLHDAALEQFRLIGAWCGAWPWTQESDPVAAFDLARAAAAKKATSPAPSAP
ncbi:hypothetical protein [Peterkaempfera griseoplana]|uniref:hypothetical protein n=1 Tax=Peterkaempfera griseoplana TaxID=66896 RepID=UPI0006E16F5C|nr:hypothetical protein [Peterkaempfera griseoplana]